VDAANAVRNVRYAVNATAVKIIAAAEALRFSMLTS